MKRSAPPPSLDVPPGPPALRDWALPQVLPLARYPALAAARDWSCRTLGRVRECLHGLERDVAVVAVSGSLGRLEAGPHSDADLIVVLADEVPPRGAAGQQALAAVWDAMAPLGLARPWSGGVFTTPTTRTELCDPATMGRVAEDVGVFGKRFQLLLDAQPVFGAAAHTALVRAILERYAAGFVARDPGKEWTYLLNDLLRYFRSLCVLYQWDFRPINGGWYGRDLKLRHSRVLAFAGLLLLLGECSRVREDRVGWLEERLRLTPLERLAWVYAARGDPHLDRLAGAYDRYLAAAADPEARRALEATAPAGPADLASPPALYRELVDNGREVVGELVRFLLARQEDWSQRFFEYLIF